MSCDCGNIYIEGGLCFARRIMKTDDFVDLAEYLETPDENGGQS